MYSYADYYSQRGGSGYAQQPAIPSYDQHQLVRNFRGLEPNQPAYPGMASMNIPSMGGAASNSGAGSTYDGGAMPYGRFPVGGIGMARPMTYRPGAWVQNQAAMNSLNYHPTVKPQASAGSQKPWWMTDEQWKQQQASQPAYGASPGAPSPMPYVTGTQGPGGRWTNF